VSKTGVIIQARFCSTRLPGKILRELPYGSGITVLEQVIGRTKKSRLIQAIVVATSTGDEEEPIVQIAEKENVQWFRGSKDDVLSRYYFAARENGLDPVVRITSDCPCIDPKIVDCVVSIHLERHCDYTSNVLKRSFPRGLDVEVFNFKALEESFHNAKSQFEREHVTPYIYKTHPEKFKINGYEAEGKLRRPDLRITVDTEEDYALLCAIYDDLYDENRLFDSYDIVDLFRRKPWLELINKKVVQKKSFESFGEEIQEAIRLLDLQDLKRAKEILSSHLK
jgi:spore coat polysaccharide biosynthesis protein SpsF